MAVVELTHCRCSLGSGIPSLKSALRYRLTDATVNDTVCSVCQLVFHTLACVRTVFETYGMVSDMKSEASLNEMGHLYHDLAQDRGKLVAFLKWKTANSFAWATRQELPKMPDWVPAGLAGPYWVGGRYCEFMKSMKFQTLKRDPMFAMGFFYSLLMMKKGLPRADEEMLHQATVDAYNTMTTPMERSITDLLTINEVKKYITKVVDKLFRPRSWDSIMMEWPSQSAHFRARRIDDGALGALRKAGLLPRFDLETANECGFYREESEMILDEDHPTRYVLREWMSDELVKRQLDLLSQSRLDQNIVLPVAIAEPVKIRVVTAGLTTAYTAIKPIQAWTKNTLCQDRRFCIGGPIDAELIRSLLGNQSLGKQFVSGDYKAATDNIAIELCDWAVSEIARRSDMPDIYMEEYRRSLTEHWYTHKIDPKGSSSCVGNLAPLKAQARGQLMGSPTSFPILCLINFALIWASTDPNADFEDVKVMINGDDCLFKVGEGAYRQWQEDAKSVGLQISVGKSYYSNEFCVINSELYWEKDNKWLYVPYLNLGLLTGQQKDGTLVSVAVGNGDTMGARCEALIRGHTVLRPSLIRQFIDHNLIDLKTRRGTPVTIPWFVPEVWGGIGLPPISDLFQVTDYFDIKTQKAMSMLFKMEDEALAKFRKTGRKESMLNIPTMSIPEPFEAPYNKRTEAYCGKKFGWIISDAGFDAGDLQFGFTQQNQDVVDYFELSKEDKKSYLAKVEKERWKQLDKVDKFWKKVIGRAEQEHSAKAFDLLRMERGPRKVIPNCEFRSPVSSLRAIGWRKEESEYIPTLNRREEPKLQSVAAPNINGGGWADTRSYMEVDGVLFNPSTLLPLHYSYEFYGVPFDLFD